jgi:hypothetical protein
MQTPYVSHWKETKRVLRYIQHIVQFGMHYSSRGTPLLVGLIDFDWAGDPDDWKSIVGYVSVLVPDLSLGLVRSNRIFLFL